MSQSRAFKVYQQFLRQLNDEEKNFLMDEMSNITPKILANGDSSYVKSFKQLASQISAHKNIQLPVQYLSMFYFSNKLGRKPVESDFSDFPVPKEEPKSATPANTENEKESEIQPTGYSFCTIL